MAQHSQPTQTVAVLTQKLFDADSDIRYMSLNDLQTAFKNPTTASLLNSDLGQCNRIVEGFIHTLTDSNGEVQNLTVEALGPFVNRAHVDVLKPFIIKICELPTDNTIDSSISAMAIRAIVMALPRPMTGVPRAKNVNDAYAAVSEVLIPRLIGHTVLPQSSGRQAGVPKGLVQYDLEKGNDSNAIDVLTQVAKCFGPMLQPVEVQALQKITLQVLESDRTGSVMKKKAIAALSALSLYFSEQFLSTFVSHIIENLRNPHLTPAYRKLYFSVLSSLAKAIPQKFGPHLATLAPFVLSALSQQELDDHMRDVEDEERDPAHDEVKEAALIALEAFIYSCGSEMQRYFHEGIDATLRYLKYDPNFAAAEDEEDGIEEDQDDDFEIDEDFEEADAGDDEDDLSWKVRRCATKTLNTIISVRSSELLANAATYEHIANALINRFGEREEVVRLEILMTLAFLIRKTFEGSEQADLQIVNGVETSFSLQPQSRKRRRGNSDASMSDPIKFGRFTGSMSPESRSPPRSGPAANLSRLGPNVVSGVIKLLKNSSLPTKQASIIVLRNLVIALKGGLDQHVPTLVDLLIENMKSGSHDKSGPSSFTASIAGASGMTFQIEALQLIAEITKTHSSSTVQPQMSKILPVAIASVRNPSPKVACQALDTCSQLIKALTPPRTAARSNASASQVEQILDALTELISAKNVDLQVRQQAISVLGTLIGRCMGPEGAPLIPNRRKTESLELMYETSKNETTRLTAIKAIEAVALVAPEKTFFDSTWFSKTCLELGAQLRKASRALRASSLSAIRTLLGHERSRNLDATSTQQLTELVRPVLESHDLQLLAPALATFTMLVRESRHQVVNDQLILSICKLTTSPVASSVLDPVCELVRAIGEKGLGRPLMQALLNDVGVKASPAVVGKVIGTLLVFGGSNTGVTVDSFRGELKTAVADSKRVCLAVSILGEVGLRSGSNSTLNADLFISYFGHKDSEVSLTAAIALGRAAAGPGNVRSWVQTILNRLKQYPKEQYLVLHSVKELLSYNEQENEILPFTAPLWEASVSASKSDETKTIGAECVANLAMIDPNKFLPALQSLLSDSAAGTRGTAILAFRDVFTVTDRSYDQDLRPIMVDVLTTMLRDPDVENRRSALNTFNAAIRNKWPLVLPHASEFLPLLIDQTFEDPALVREVNMGPFKHKVDDGLEVRKSAYETLYSLMEIAPSSLDIIRVYDRVVAGIKDETGIRTLCLLMLSKLTTAVPEETARRLDDLSDQFRAVLAVKLKENAVRHEVEKTDEARRSVVKVTIELQKDFPGEATSSSTSGKSKWTNYLEDVKSNEASLWKDVEKEMREKERS